jgi:hypothetical protein
MKIDEIMALKEGDILHASWGYDMTMNEFAVIVKKTPKSFVCRMIGTKTVSGSAFNPGGSQVVPDPEAILNHKPFRVRIYQRNKFDGNGYAWMTGSYPYCEGKDNMRRECWYPHDEGRSYYENHVD